MKPLFVTIGVAIFTGILVWLWFYTAPKVPQPTTGTETPVVTGQPSQTASSTTTTPAQNQPIPNQTSSAGTQSEIAHALIGQIQNPNLITLKGTTIVSTYALQAWGDENRGGEALLQYNPPNGWLLLSMGGGVWDVSSLVAASVPQSIAEQLIAGR